MGRGKCVSYVPAADNEKDVSYSDSMQQFVQSSSTHVGLSGGGPVEAVNMKGSVQLVTGHDSTMTSTFHSAELKISVTVGQVTLDTEQCLLGSHSLALDFLRHFRGLPMIQDNLAKSTASWQPYVQFLKGIGSHVMVSQFIGSSFRTFASTTSTSKTASRTMGARVCLAASSAGNETSGSGCASFTRDEMRQSSSMNAHVKTEISGGTEKTRAALMIDMNDQTLGDFIRVAAQGDLPMQYKMKPVWLVLQALFQEECAASGANSEACQDLQRATNLQAAYEGWMSVGCPFLETSDHVVYQSFQVQNPEAAVGSKLYQCHAARTGCYYDSDCHTGGAGTVTYCYGSSCLDQGERLLGGGFRTKVKGSKSGSYKHGVNQACYYKVFHGARCHKGWAGGLPDRYIYQQGAQYSAFLASAISSNELMGNGTATIEDGALQLLAAASAKGFLSKRDDLVQQPANGSFDAMDVHANTTLPR